MGQFTERMCGTNGMNAPPSPQQRRHCERTSNLNERRMVRATLAEIKSQTRRIVKPSRAWPIDFVGGSGQINDPTCWGFEDGDTALWWLLKRDDDALSRQIPCPYGQPGDRLWVRETYYAFGRWETRFSAKKKRDEWHFVDMTRDTDRLYQFGTESIEPCLRARDPGILPTWWKRPSIFMPRDASRILLEIRQRAG